jgi:hypothetical protein
VRTRGPILHPPVRTKRSHLNAACERSCERSFAVNVQYYQCANGGRSHHVRRERSQGMGCERGERGTIEYPFAVRIQATPSPFASMRENCSTAGKKIRRFSPTVLWQSGFPESAILRAF